MKLSNKNKIVAYLHCGLCLKEYLDSAYLKKSKSPAEYARTQAGWTKEGIQIWCNRHNCNIMHIDFEGQRHPANNTIPKKVKQ